MTPGQFPRGEHFKALAEASPAAIFIVQNGLIRYANPAMAAITEYGREELVGSSAFDLLHPAGRDAVEARLRSREPDDLTSLRDEVHVRTKGGGDRWIDLTTAAFAHEGGRAVVAIGIDVTARRELEDRIQKRQQLEAVGRLAGGVAHDFNNLLLVITGEAERLLEGLTTQNPLRASAEAVAQSAQRAAALTQHLLAFGRKQMLIARPLDLNQLMAELAHIYGDATAAISLETVLAESLPAVRVDPMRLEQVLHSIIANAREAFGGGGGRIIIQTDVVRVGPGLPDDSLRAGRPWLPEASFVRLRISDTGPGIRPETLARVFEPFFTTKTEPGSGLGLSTVYGIIKQSGGFVWIDSTVDTGSTVTILLPPAGAAAEIARPAAARPVATPRVLLVDDEPGVVDLLTTILTRNGFEVTSAGSAEEALDSLGEVRPTLLLTDVVLPGLSGAELARRLRQRFPQLLVLFMSGFTGDALQDEGDLADTRAFIQKPFESRALLARIRSLLESGADA